MHWLSHNKKMIKVSLIYCFLILGSLIMLLPLIYAFVSSMKSDAEVFTIPMRWIPKKIIWNNYIEPFRKYPFVTYFLNSIMVSLTVTVFNLFLCSLAGYSLAKLNFYGRNFIFVLILGTLMLPIQTTFLPLYLIVKSFGWLNSYKVLITPFVVDAFSVFLFRQYIQTIPDELINAARIDGCSEFKIYWKIIIPLILPAIATGGIFAFLRSWQSYLWVLITINKAELKTLPLGLVSFQQDYYAAYGQLFAMSILALLPTLIIFIVLQRRLITHMVLSGMKV